MEIKNRIKENRLISTRDLKIGDVAIVEKDDSKKRKEMVILRSFSGLVNLYSPDETWTFNNYSSLPDWKCRRVNCTLFIEGYIK